MAIPDYQEIMLPLLQFLGDEKEHTIREAIEHSSKVFSLSPDERDERLPSGTQRVIDNRVGWARTYMIKAGLIESVGRGKIKISPRGRQVLSQKPLNIDQHFLGQFKEFQAFKQLRGTRQARKPPRQPQTPEEQLEEGYRLIRSNLADELIKRVKSISPKAFEQLVLDLLVKMGYGGPTGEAKRIGGPRDAGIDVLIREDKLGLDTIYVQAKRWEEPVGLNELQRFSGTLDGKPTKKGIFVTTSSFREEAIQYSKNLSSKTVILVDGKQLAELMIDHNVGVSSARPPIEIKRIDTDYFETDAGTVPLG